jgi:hypothetical protein
MAPKLLLWMPMVLVVLGPLRDCLLHCCRLLG